MSIYQKAKERLDIVDVAMYYGLQFKNKKALCPFHKERTPSLSFKDNYFMCFGCGEKGDTISLVSKLFSISPYDALKKLDSDFMLGLDLMGSQVNENINRYIWEAELRKSFDRWIKDSFNVINKHVRDLRSVINKYSPSISQGEFNSQYENAIKKVDYYEYLLDKLTFGDEEEKIAFYKNYRKEVKSIERRQLEII